MERAARLPGRGPLLAAISRRLGRSLVDGEVTIDARVVATARGGYTLHLRLVAGARGETREVDDPSCAALTDVTALRVVAALESAAALVPPAPVPEPPQVMPEPERIPQVQAPPTTVVTPTPPPPEPAVPKARSGPGGVLRLHGGGELGVLLGPTGALGLDLGLLWPRVRVELQGTVLTPRDVPRASSPVRAGMYAGAVHRCGRLGRGALEFPICLGLEIGAVRGEARQIPGAQAAAGLWVAAVLAPGLSWHASPRVSLWTSLQLVLAPVRPKFERGDGDPAETIFTPAPASGRLLIGVELRLRDPW